MNPITVPTETVPVIGEFDICVLGGSCTGVFAAVRAARLGANVAIIEKQNRFGGVATSSLVHMWHSLYDIDYKKQIIAGLTLETLERLAKRDAAATFINPKNYGVPLNSEELTIELDELIIESGVTPYLNTFFSSPVLEDGNVAAVVFQDKSGRRAVKAKVFIDATGDADLCLKAGLEVFTPNTIQPPTACARFTNWTFPDDFDPLAFIRKHMDEFNLPEGFMWGSHVPNSDVFMLAGTRVTGKNPADADDLTYCEMEGRRQVRVITDIFRTYAKDHIPQLHALPSLMGIRESRHIKSAGAVTGDDILSGRKFDDAIANGTYPVDIHHQDKPGITFLQLDGVRRYCRPGREAVVDRWREDSSEGPKHYQIPLSSIIPKGSKNVITAGRMIDADPKAFGAVRVMVNLNQTGEAAGVAAFLALDSNTDINVTKAKKVRELLAKGGSIVL